MIKELPFTKDLLPDELPRQNLAIKIPVYEGFSVFELIQAATTNMRLDPLQVMNCDFLFVTDISDYVVAVLKITGTYKTPKRNRIGILFNDTGKDHSYNRKKINFKMFRKIRFVDIEKDLTRSRAINH